MRKKSAFLERLTARAAAAFEAGGSYGAIDSEARTEVHSPSQDASMPSPSLHEPTMRSYAQADAQSKPTLSHVNVGLVDSPSTPNAEQSTQLDIEVYPELHAQVSTELDTDVHAELNTQQSAGECAGINTQRDIELSTELSAELHAATSLGQNTVLSTQENIQEGAQLSTEQGAELHGQEGALGIIGATGNGGSVDSTDHSEFIGVQAEQSSQLSTLDTLQGLVVQNVEHGADTAEEQGQLGVELSAEQNTQVQGQISQQVREEQDDQEDSFSPADLSAEQSTEVHTEQPRHELKPVNTASTTAATIPATSPSGANVTGLPSMVPLMSPVIDSDEERICASLGDVAKVLFAHLIAMEKNVLNMKRLRLYNHKNLPIPYTSIRTAWTRLKTLKIISHSARHDIGKEKGVLFQLDGVYTFAFQKMYPHMLVGVRAGQNMGQSAQLSTELHTGLGAGVNVGLSAEQNTQLSTELNTQVHTELGMQQGACLATQPSTLLSPQVSAQLHTQLSTQDVPLTEIPKPKTKLEGHPEYAFWRDCGLSQTQCTRWKEEFGLDDLLLDNYLRWCAHDVGHDERKDKSGKTISNPANWFYTIMKKAGAYPKPEGYQSHEEKIFLVRENLLKEQAALHARQNDLRAQEERQEAEGLFAAFLEEGESSQQFHELCAKISPFLYENRHTRRRLFENALRTEYFAFLGIDAGHKE